MENLIIDFTNQLKQGLVIAERNNWQKGVTNFKNVIISGMGGSGIGGTIVSEIALKESKIPIIVNKDYFLPKYVNTDSLVIVSSYSGNTEETFNVYNEAIKSGAKVVVITSGGQILEKAIQQKIDYFQLPKCAALGVDSPRAALGYSIIALFKILSFFEIISEKFELEIKNTILFLTQEQKNIQITAKEIAAKIGNRLPIIYTANELSGVAIRFQQQLNENAKILAWHSLLPEMNHNELLGWQKTHSEIIPIFLRTDTIYNRTKARIDFSIEHLKKYTDNVIEINAFGKTSLDQIFYLIHLNDFISLYLADLKRVDIMNVDTIEKLKSRLAEIN